jgi:hypothetical protein
MRSIIIDLLKGHHLDFHVIRCMTLAFKLSLYELRARP